MAFTLLNNDTEQKFLEFEAKTALIYISMDLSTITGTVVIREYEKVDGVNYTLLSSAEFPGDFPTGIKSINIAHSQLNCDYKVTLQAAVLEGYDRQIPYRFGVEEK